MLIITVLALLMAATMAWLAVRLLREEQRRSGARIAALAAALETPAPALRPEEPATGTGTVAFALSRLGTREVTPPAAPLHVPEIVSLDDTRPEVDFASEEPRSAPLVAAAPLADAAGPEADAPAPAAFEGRRSPERPMFGQSDGPAADADTVHMRTAGELFADGNASPRSDDRRWLAVAAVVVLFLLGGAAIWSLSGGSGTAARTPAQAAATSGLALELVALGHDQAGKVLVVRGLVRNPPAASTRTNTYVHVRLFDESGAPLDSGRGVLDVPQLVPGDEAAFAVELPADPRVRRYRVTFREPDGNLVPHVDIRTASR